MKRWMAAALLGAALQGNEIERIESIVNDVTQLRARYEECRATLALMGNRQNDAARCSAQEERIRTLEAESEKLREQNRVLQHALEHATAQATQLEQLVQEQKRHIASLNTARPAEERPAPAPARCVAECPDPNPFPKLAPKQLEAAAVPVRAAEPAATPEAESVSFEAAAFRLVEESAIYDAPGGKVVARWEAQTSFTSNRKRGGWIQITGYFVDRKWRPCSGDERLWVEERLAQKR